MFTSHHTRNSPSGVLGFGIASAFALSPVIFILLRTCVGKFLTTRFAERSVPILKSTKRKHLAMGLTTIKTILTQNFKL